MTGPKLPIIPRGWVWTTLAEIAHLTGGITKGQKLNGKMKSRLVPYLRVANVQRGYLDLNEMKFIEATEDDIAALRLHPGDVLFNEGGDRDKLGRGWVWEGQISECIHQNHVFRARLLSSELKPRFISHWGNSFGQRWFMSVGKQSVNLASINLTNLRAFPVPVPPPAEQQRILDVLDELLSDLDAGAQALRSALAKVSQYRAAVLKAAVEGALTADWRKNRSSTEPATVRLTRILAERRCRWEEGRLEEFRSAGKEPPKNWKTKYKEPMTPNMMDFLTLPEGWCWVSVDQVIREPLRNGHSAKATSAKDGIPTFSLSAVTKGDFSEKNIKMTSANPERVRGLWVERDDIFIQRSNTPELVGTTCRYQGESNRAIFPDLLIRIRVAPSLDPSFVERALQSSRSHTYFRKNAQGISGSMPKIGQEVIERCAIPLPPLEEQNAISEVVEEQFSIIQHLESDLLTKLKSAHALRHSILRYAFEGKLVAQNPKDEPATELLKRIAVEREKRIRDADADCGANKKERSGRDEKGAPSPRPHLRTLVKPYR